MNTSDSAEEFVRLYLDGVEHCIKIAGVGAKNIAVILIAMSKEKKQTKGKTRLTNMLKTGKPLTIFTIKADDLKKFSQEAKKYGVLYCALANKKNSKIDGMVDIMVREEDAAKLNRIAERFNFKDVATIQREFEKEKQERAKQAEINNKEKPKSEEEQFIDDIMPKENEEQKEIPSNNTKEAEEKSQSEISSNIKLNNKVKDSDNKKKSVKEELKNAEIEAREKELARHKDENIIIKDKNKESKHLKQEKDEKNKGKHFKNPKHMNYTNKSKRKKIKNKGRSE